MTPTTTTETSLESAHPAPRRLGRPTTGHFREVPHIAGLVIGVYATLVFLWSISPVLRYLVRTPREYVNNYYFDAPDTSIVWALVLALLAAALASRKRIAWWLLTVYLILIALTNLAQVIVERNMNAALALVVHLAVIGVLIAARKEFYTRVRRGAGWKALGVLLLGLAIGTLLGWALVELFPGTLPSDQRLLWSLNRVFGGVVLENEQFDGRTHGFVSTILGLLGALALLAAVVTLFRSQRSDNALTGDDESALRGLLARSGADDSLGYFATRRDKAVIFAPSGKAAVTYRVELGVCLASGDPIGDEEAWPHAVDAWLDLASNYGWTPAVMGASELGATAYARAGLTVLQLGDEAILHTREFNLGGREMRQVRQAVNRVRKQGVTVRIRRHRDIPPEEMAKVIARADSWRDTETERGFSMALGRLGDIADGDCLLVEAIGETDPDGDGTSDGEVLGILSLVPWGLTGVSLDLMRRNPKAPNGVVELMVTELATGADRFGVNKVSLNFAVFRSVFEEGARIGAGPVLRVWRSILVFFSKWWQLEALYRSNVKYQPDWAPRYLCFSDSRVLPKVGMASAVAEGFVTLPRWRRRDISKHTGTRIAVPQSVAAAGLLHSDGSAPDDVAALATETVGPRRPEQVRVRMDKLDRMAAHGIDPYPVAYPPTHTVAAAASSPEGTRVRIAGRLMRIRAYGGVAFAEVRDWSGDLQVLFDRTTVGDRLDEFTADFDLGDLIEVSGTIGRSRKGELSVLAAEWRMNGKCLHPLPDKWKGLSDPETRVRQRYLDLAINAEARDLLTARSAVVKSLRDSLTSRAFMEVETPILQQVHGGANAAPFITHINAYNLDLYLRIAPELYLKRLCVAGMERVFEIGRVFRNEGVDFKHNPEFTILEAYEAHSDYERMMVLCRELIQAAAVAAHGREIILRPGPDGTPVEVDISGDWPVKTMHGAVAEKLGVEVTPETPIEELRRLCDENGIPHQSDWDAGAVAQEMYEHLVEDQTEFPTFYTNFPTSMSPLTRPHPTIPGVAAKWDLVAWGVELGTAYSELTDPVDQRRRLTEQSLLAAGGDEEAMELDEDFLQALEHAMPPTGGIGMGVDRIVMLITGGSIRESLAFPLAKPRQ
ncbi:lysyl-tRNA synthetase class 2 [Rhodococcus sp. PvR044]|jgi:lysyl-tRNA synthetase, class II|uniref:bifunctional lysylphosphatidylglycerol synthetase/lysine--tRNA ligase LysX n=1 Tax=Rhodococcus TaxID=1827 RepID=UPI000BC6C68D|nr:MULTISPECIES: bifunctional lysylphosphatidylglycerol synthetase/lysine--tRNA ligase LysX [Rhodococcus]MBP1161384.1 lysyl-tRNA synthetase class 2 [Rhodococcus sp. PvR099]MCZ4555972.1 bifunctional lysylphosphatidylglycerol synthetase/lysine--tRNA ligase LysX [Rhodococcus maanshanensis]PTR44550.1 lysyl-tRNA synthetase class II [Rhodococcus sp. OK611]SNX89991.1 lysyl-tRNA synthetase, class II [Rhodococcus sp. OK270]